MSTLHIDKNPRSDCALPGSCVEDARLVGQDSGHLKANLERLQTDDACEECWSQPHSVMLWKHKHAGV